MAEGNVFDALKVDDIGGVDEEAWTGFLDSAMVGDVEVVGFVDDGAEDARYQEEGIEGKNNDVEIANGGGIKAELASVAR